MLSRPVAWCLVQCLMKCGTWMVAGQTDRLGLGVSSEDQVIYQPGGSGDILNISSAYTEPTDDLLMNITDHFALSTRPKVNCEFEIG